MKKVSFAILFLAGVGGSGCAAHRHEVYSPCLDGRLRGVIFCVDGAGGFLSTSNAVSEAVAQAHLPLAVQPVDWSHGYGRFLADQIDWAHSRQSGCKLAHDIVAYHQAVPQGKVYLLAHSAGSSVALAAAEALPPGSIDRIILLAPSIASDYDLRPALQGTRDGIDVFCSKRDVWQFGIGVALVGTADGCWGCTAAGRTGFQYLSDDPRDAPLYAKLRQHPWDPDQGRTGNQGGHYGAYRPGFLQAFVLPLLDERHLLPSGNGSL
jgi:pimeloyl-ACP methyl ester carboxylesterase